MPDLPTCPGSFARRLGKGSTVDCPCTQLEFQWLTPAILGGRFRDWTLAPDRGRDEGLTSPLPPNWTGGFPASSFPVSGVSARCVPLLPRTRNSGQTCGACQVNFARRVSLRCIALAGTSVGLSSVFLSVFLPPSCVPWLHARYALLRYYGRSDSCRAVLRAFGPRTPGYARQVSLLASLTLPAILSPTTRRRCRGFAFAHGFFQHAFIVLLAGSASNGEALPCTGSRGYRADFAQRSQARPTVWPNRVHVAYLRCGFVTDWQFTSGSPPPRVATTQ